MKKYILILLLMILLAGCSVEVDGSRLQPTQTISSANPSSEPTATPEASQSISPTPITSGANPTSPASIASPTPESGKGFPKDQVTDDDFLIIYDSKKIALRMNKADFDNIINNPIINTEIDDKTFKEFTVSTILYENNTKAVFNGDSLYSISVSDKNYITTRGLKVGDSVDKLIDLYGNPKRIHEESYSYEYLNSGYITFIVTTNNNIVTEIKITLIM